MVGLGPCRIWVMSYETKLGEYLPRRNISLGTLIGKGMIVGTWKQLYLRQPDTNGVVHRRPGGCARQSSRGRVQYHGGGVKNKLQGYKSSMSPESQYADDRPHIRYNYLPTENSISERTRHEEKQHKANKRRLKVVYRANSIIPMEKPHK